MADNIVTILDERDMTEIEKSFDNVMVEINSSIDYVEKNHHIKTYTDIAQLGLQAGSETIDSIVLAMPDNSRLFGAVGSANNNNVYPVTYGMLDVNKIDKYRTMVFFYQKGTGSVWRGAYDAAVTDSPWSGWIQ